MASFRAVRRALCTAAEATPPPAPAPASVGRWERLKNSKAGVWCRSMLSDYKAACEEIVVGARDRPLKASVYMGLLGGAYACFTTKPDQPSFQAALLDRSNQLALLSPWIRNAESDLHVQKLVKLRNHGQLRHLSLGLFSLVYSADHDPDSALYEATCSNLSVPWRELPKRVLDVGFAGRWWVLNKKMEDFDVNEAEYKHLPTHMQATAPPSVQEVERNERLHRESWLPLPVPKEETQVKMGDSQDVETVDTKLDTRVMETVDVNVDSQAAETIDINVDSQVTETIDVVDSQVKETIDVVDSQVKETIDLVDSRVKEMIDLVDSRVEGTIDLVDSQVKEMIDLVDSPVKETIDLVDSQVKGTIDIVDSQVTETVDGNVGSQVKATIDLVESQVKESTDINGDGKIANTVDIEDSQVMDTTDVNVDSQVTETTRTNEQAKSGDTEETPLDVMDTNADSHDVETVDKEKGSPAVENSGLTGA